MNEMFPTDDPRTWNGGAWPPPSLHNRWRKLHLAAVTGLCANPDPQSLDLSATRAVADWALRREVEAGVAAP